MKTLLLVDIQNDFLPGGSLAVPAGDEVVPVANRLMADFELVVATQDWHPANHLSFASQHRGHQVGDVVEVAGLEQFLWPDHCVQGTHGAELAEALDTARIVNVVQKGIEREIDSYSGFFDNGHRRATGLEYYLRAQGADDLYIVGLATDVCVKYTALDAVQLGYRTTLLVEGTRGVELKEGDCHRAIEEMRTAGVLIK